MNKINELAKKHLGQNTSYEKEYNPNLLVKIPRIYNREAMGIDNDYPFFGVDVWNAYEVSAISTKGQPVAGMLKIVCPSDSEYHVESKSIKLYLNSFNMTRIGDNAADCISGIEARVKRDLDELLETNTTVSFYSYEDEAPGLTFNYNKLEDLVDLDSLDFTSFKSDASQLQSDTDPDKQDLKVYSNLLR